MIVFWCFINGICECDHCGNCNEYISVNSDIGMELYEKYQEEVEEALKPLAEKWKKIKEDMNNESKN